MDNFVVLSAFVLGLFGTVFSVCQFFYQKHKDKEQAEREAQRDKEQAARDKELALQHRLDFLMQVIIDKDIPRESRQPFYDEYLEKGGNGTVIKFWLENK